MPAAPTEKAGLRLILSDPAVRVIVLIVFVVMLGFGVIAPILPLYARSFGVSYQTASLLISVFAFSRLIFDPIAGPIIDRYGERRSAVVGVLIVGVTALLAGLAPTFLLAVVFRGAGGGGSAVFIAALYSYLLKVVPSERMARTLSVFYGSLNVGIIAGGPIGGFVAETFGLASPLILYSGLCFLSAALYVRFMRDAPRRDESGRPEAAGAEAAASSALAWRPLTRQAAVLLRTPAFITVLVVNLSFFWFVAGAYDTLVPLFGREHLGMSAVGVGVVFTIAVAAEFLVLYPTASVADKIGRKPVVVPSMAALAAIGATLGFAESPVMFGVLMGLVGLASGAAASTPAAMLSDIAPESGMALGLFRFAGDLGFVLGPLVGGVVAGAFGFKAGFAAMGIPAVIALLFALRTPETLGRDAATHLGRPLPGSALD